MLVLYRQANVAVRLKYGTAGGMGRPTWEATSKPSDTAEPVS